MGGRWSLRWGLRWGRKGSWDRCPVQDGQGEFIAEFGIQGEDVMVLDAPGSSDARKGDIKRQVAGGGGARARIKGGRSAARDRPLLLILGNLATWRSR
jgi:hypothetical protein